MIELKTIEEHITALSHRVDRLESGGRPLVGLSTLGGGSLTVGATSKANFTVTLNWSDANVTANPHGVLYWIIYVDNDNDADYVWGRGASVNEDTHVIRWRYAYEELQADTNKNRLQFQIHNKDSSSHTYYIDTRWTYVTGSSGSS